MSELAQIDAGVFDFGMLDVQTRVDMIVVELLLDQEVVQIRFVDDPVTVSKPFNLAQAHVFVRVAFQADRAVETHLEFFRTCCHSCFIRRLETLLNSENLIVYLVNSKIKSF